jgi:hypothetical protein
MAHELVFDSILSSNLPRHEKSTIMQWFDKHTDGRASRYSNLVRGGQRHISAGLSAVRQSGESLIAGSLLGALHAELKTGLDVGKVPLDLVLAATAMPAGVALAHHDGAEDLRNVAASGFTVFGFRKTYGLLAEHRLAAGATPARIAGESDMGHDDEFAPGEDPIIAAAKLL